MRNHWAACAFACALIATLPTTLAAQTPESIPAPTTSTVDVKRWGPYAKLAGQTVQDSQPRGFRLHWRWEIPGEALVQEWYRGSENPENSGKPVYMTTLRLAAQPGTFILKGTAMMGKEWVGTLNEDGSVSFVGKGLLKMRYTIRINGQGIYEETFSTGYTAQYPAVTNSAMPIAVAQTPPPATPEPTSAPASTLAPAPTPVVATPTPAPVAGKKPAPVVARPKEVVASLPPVKAPRKLTDAELALIVQSVQKSRALSAEQARQIQLAQQEAARQAELQAQIWAAENARREAEQAQADAEFEAERAEKAAAWQQQRDASEQALNASIQRLNETTARIQAQQAEAANRQREQQVAVAQAERQRQMELVRQANQRQEDEAARLAMQRQQYEQQRAATQATERQSTQPQGNPGSVAGAGHASTDTDANRCVTSAQVKENDTFKGNTAAYVTNGCGTMVEVKICLKTESGWKCGANGQLVSQGSWSFSAFNATGPVFVDAKVVGSSRRLGSPN